MPVRSSLRPPHGHVLHATGNSEAEKWTFVQSEDFIQVSLGLQRPRCVRTNVRVTVVRVGLVQP